MLDAITLRYADFSHAIDAIVVIAAAILICYWRFSLDIAACFRRAAMAFRHIYALLSLCWLFFFFRRYSYISIVCLPPLLPC